MVSHWSLIESKSPQVSMALLSILADLNNAVVWMITTHTVISKSFSPCANSLVSLPRAPITSGIIVISCPITVLIPLQGWGTYLCFYIIWISLSNPPGQQSPQFCLFSFFLFVFWWYKYPVVGPRFGPQLFHTGTCIVTISEISDVFINTFVYRSWILDNIVLFNTRKRQL